MQIERRYFETELKAETREGKETVIIGHGAVFNSLSENLGGFREMILPGAFDDVLKDDVRALFNHNSDKILGRTKSNTLVLTVDEKGLRYEITPPDTSYANDLLMSLKRGDITQSSFGFNIEKDNWKEDTDGRVIREIIKIKRLWDVSPVTFPAYPDADSDVAKRGYEQFLKSKESVITIDKEKIQERINKLFNN
jgi:hypothetical protein